MTDDADTRLQTSARGWLTLQLATLGFAGLCGALKSGGTGGSGAPRAVEAVAGVLVLLALGVACAATYLVARIAWPVHAPRTEDAVRAGRRLRLGIGLTFLAVLLVAVAASTAWWPQEATSQAGAGAGAGALVEVSTTAGTWCGTLRPSGGDVPGLEVTDGGQTVDIPLGEVTALRPVGTCGA
ncbi:MULTISPECIES: hypothetical protein [Streptomyces]|jgi:hypothetical protein|uniref:Uncharacterized protein n=1 Tax=Streptomyces nymphaeiformis TaxID=2663842 RepID=A0A7W7XB55_9ACTN|nr:hypothetical protein [Streptomyces nymphaeiformis]MBB4982219.1 hypothetical protein [Streptomyces nymphaeiformis]